MSIYYLSGPRWRKRLTEMNTLGDILNSALVGGYPSDCFWIVPGTVQP